MARDYPAFLFYPEDFAAGTAAMSPLAVGIYIRCLCHQWSHGSLPNDQEAITRIAGAMPDETAKAWPTVSKKFQEVEPGILQNVRLETERQKLIKQGRKRSSAGRRGAMSRWGDDKPHGKRDGKGHGKRMANAKQNDNKNMASRVANANANANETGLEIANANAFDEFWALVPNKVGKRTAEKAYKLAVSVISLRPVEAGPGADDPHGFLLERMRAFAASPVGRGDPQYIPHPATWLNAGRYDDDPRIWQAAGKRDPRGTISAAQQYLGGLKNGQ